MSLVDQLSRRRAGLPVSPARPGPGAAKPGAAPPSEALLSEKTWNKYGGVLSPAAVDLRALSARAEALRPHEAKTIGRAMDRFCAELGQVLEALPEGERAAVLHTAFGAVGRWVDRLGADDRLIGVLEVYGAMLGRGAPPPGTAGPRSERAAATLDAFLDDLSLRVGAATLCFGLRNLIELSIDRRQQLPLEGLAEIWSSTASLLLQATPTKGATAAEVSQLAGRYAQQLKQGARPEAAAAQVLAGLSAESEGARNATIAQLAQLPALPADHHGLKAYQAVAQSLTRIVESNPIPGPTLLPIIEGIATATRQAAPGINATKAPIWLRLAALFDQITDHPGAEGLLESYVGVRMVNEAAAQVLLRQPLEQEPAITLLACRAAVSRRAIDLQPLSELRPEHASAVALALIPMLQSGGHAHLYPELLRRAPSARTIESLITYARRFEDAFKRSLPLPAPLNVRIPAALAESPVPDKTLGAVTQRVAGILPGLKVRFPELDLVALLLGHRAGEAGLVDLPKANEQGRDPLRFLMKLLDALPPGPELPPEALAPLARRAIRVALELARLDRDPEAVLQQVATDWKDALANPERLARNAGPQKSAALRAERPSALRFLESHPELPPELALTAGLHLTPEQLGYVQKEIKEERSHGRVRLFRDLIFLSSAAGRFDVLEALRASPAPKKIKDAWLQRLVGAYRQNQGELPFDETREGLRAGTDPGAEFAVNDDSPLGRVLGVPVPQQVDRAAVEEILREAPTLKTLFEFFPAGKQVWGVAAETFRKPLQEWLVAYAQGDVAAYKYGHPISKKMMEGLSEGAQALWAERTITPIQGAPVSAPPAGPVHPALPLLLGAEQVLPKVRIATAEWPHLAFDPASLAFLEGERARRLEALRGEPKGSAAHRTLKAELGPIQERLALLELHLGLAERRQAPGGASAETLAWARPYLQSAARFIRKQGGEELAQVLAELAGMAPKTAPSSHPARYVSDEHSLGGYLQAFGGGSCINPVRGLNRGVLVEKMASSRYKMCLAWNGDQLILRSFLRLVDVTLPGYQGKALWIDPPTAANSTATDRATVEAMSKAMIGHALEKAMAMGIPFLCNSIGTVAKDHQRTSAQLRVTISLDRGHTGVHHTQKMAGIGPYGVAWPELKWPHGKLKPAAGAQVVPMSGMAQVVMPPALAAPA